MDELPHGSAPPSTPERVGDTLRAARERLGLALAEIAARTRVPLRHLTAIENNAYGDLPSATYANGFAKAYARAVGEDEVAIGRRLRGELAGVTRPTPAYAPYEATDPNRVPSRTVAIVSLGLALAVLILAGLYFGTGLFHRDVNAATPAAATDATGVAVATPQLSADQAVAPLPTPSSAIPADGEVLVTANDEVWVRIYDADGKTLHQGTLQPGERFDVPADANQPMINVGRPDKISITVNGAAVPGLDLGRDPIKDVRVSAAALAARVTEAAAPTPTPTPEAVESDRPRTTSRPRREEERPRRRTSASSGLSETARANLEAARAAPAPGNTQ